MTGERKVFHSRVQIKTDDLLKVSNMVISTAMEGRQDQTSIRGFVMVNDLRQADIGNNKPKTLFTMLISYI